MHVEIIDEFALNIYIPNRKVKQINFEIRDEIEFYFKKIFNDLKEIYNIEIKGYYNINVYKDKYYGIVMELIKEEIDYIDFLDNQVEMNIKVVPKEFFYKIEDIFFIDNILKEKIQLYNYKNNIYIKIIDSLSDISMAKLLEFSTLIYNESINNIIKKGKILYL